ncbi:MAG: ThiF family adenylyltransferase [Candidatus Bathyarchaeota archaeon]|nr:ThiF family adenylyltransferase [Candidatus Bathyarchaeota archaeon]
MSLGRYERQLRLFGEEGQRQVRESYVGIVGAGGLGSHLIQQLAFLGVGKLAIIDSDELKETDLNRLIGSRHDDITTRANKVDIAKRLVHSINPSIDVTVIPRDLIDERSFSAIKKASCVFGCVDNDGARLVLNELCVAFEIPYFDLASDIGNKTGLVYGGRVFANTDDGGCLFCYGLISPSQARTDLMSPEARRKEETIYGVPKEHLDRTGPSVVSINGVIASLAVTEFMAMITGLRPPYRLLQYHGHRGIVNLNVDKPYPDCYYCKYVRGRRESAEIDRYWKAKMNSPAAALP